MNALKNGGVIILIIMAIIFGIRLLSPEDSWECKNGSWQQHGNPQSAMPSTPCQK